VEKKPAFGVFSLLYLNPIRVVLAPNQYSWQNNFGSTLIFSPIMQKWYTEKKQNRIVSPFFVKKFVLYLFFFCEENRTVSASAKHELRMVRTSTQKYLLLVSWSLTCDTVVNRGGKKTETQKNQDQDWSSKILVSWFLDQSHVSGILVTHFLSPCSIEHIG
jgi:hypothetical protein